MIANLPPWLIILAPKRHRRFLLAFAAAVGSFLNVVVFRLPRGGASVRRVDVLDAAGG